MLLPAPGNQQIVSGLSHSGPLSANRASRVGIRTDIALWLMLSMRPQFMRVTFTPHNTGLLVFNHVAMLIEW